MKKKMITAVAITVAATAGVGGVCVGQNALKTRAAAKAEQAVSSQTEEQDASGDGIALVSTQAEENENEIRRNAFIPDSTEVSKEETVFVTANADGSVKEVSVSDWLRNSGGMTGALLDKTDLTDIENVKGDETFLKDGRTLVWNTDREDIYYQGSTTRRLPVDMDIRYYLNGAQCNAEELAGKSGHLRMEVSFKNRASVEKMVSGKKTTIYSPFVMVTGMILPSDHFYNVKVDNGKCIGDGSRTLVLGYSMPGLKESLNLPDDTSDILPVSDGFVMEADVTDCEMNGTYTAALTDILSDLDTDSIGNLDELKDAIDKLDDAASELTDGSQELADGTGELRDKYKEFSDGMKQLADGIGQLSSGSRSLQSGLQTYTDGVDTLAGGIESYTSGVSTLGKGVKDYTEGVGTLADGLGTYMDGVDTLGNGVKQYTSGADTLSTRPVRIPWETDCSSTRPE